MKSIPDVAGESELLFTPNIFSSKIFLLENSFYTAACMQIMEQCCSAESESSLVWKSSSLLFNHIALLLKSGLQVPNSSVGGLSAPFIVQAVVLHMLSVSLECVDAPKILSKSPCSAG